MHGVIMRAFWAQIIIDAGYAYVAILAILVMVNIYRGFRGRLTMGSYYRLPRRLSWFLYIGAALIALGQTLKGGVP